MLDTWILLQVLIYLDLVEIPESLEEKKWKNRVEKVSQAILKEQMEEAVDREDEEEDDGDEEGEVDEGGEGGVVEGEANNNGEKKADIIFTIIILLLVTFIILPVLANDDHVLSSQEGEGGIMEGEANNGEKKADGWVEDPDSDIMDAKVMRMLNMILD